MLGYVKLFYPDADFVAEKKAAKSFTYEVRKLVKEKIVNKPHRVGLGAGSKIDFFGSTQQVFWHLRVGVDFNQFPKVDLAATMQRINSNIFSKEIKKLKGRNAIPHKPCGGI